MNVVASFFPFSFLRLEIHSSIESLFLCRQSLDERDIEYIAIISWCNRIATTSLSAVEPLPLLLCLCVQPLRARLPPFAQVAKEGRYSSFEDSLTRGVTGDSKRERKRERVSEWEEEREREEKRRGSRLKTNTLPSRGEEERGERARLSDFFALRHVHA